MLKKKEYTRINKYCSTLLLAWQVLALMQNGFSNFDLKRIKPQALMPGAKLRSDNVTALPSVLLQISSQDVLLELANPGQQRGVAINRTFFCYLMSSVIRAQGHTWDWRYLEHRRPGHVQICTGLKIWAAISQCLERFKDSEMLIKYDQVPRFRFIRYIDIFNIFNYHFLARVKQNSSLFHSRLCSQICKKKFWHRWPAPVRKTPWLFWEVRRYTSFDRCKSGKPFYLPMLGEQTCTRSTCAFEHSLFRALVKQLTRKRLWTQSHDSSGEATLHFLDLSRQQTIPSNSVSPENVFNTHIMSQRTWLLI